MKAVKRLFGRKKSRQPEAGAVARQSVPQKSILKASPLFSQEGQAMMATDKTETVTAPSPLVDGQQQKQQQPPTEKSVSTYDNTERNSNTNSLPKSATATGDSEQSPSASSHEDSKDKHKGVSESFRKGISPKQRYGIEDSHVEPPVSVDASQLCKLGEAYDSIPLLEETSLPRGGISMETKAVGRIQFGIPPETIKDSMTLGIPVPQVYIVPAERFCREMGPALGVNLAEFEFPAYFNFFVCKKRCTLVVDSQEAEDNICRVFNETLLGPAQFRREIDPVPYEEEDFAPDFPRDAIPNLEKELRYFRIGPDGKELAVDVLLEFTQFRQPGDGYYHENLGVPPNVDAKDVEDDEEFDEEDIDEALGMVEDEETGEEETLPADARSLEERGNSTWSYKKARWVGDVATVWPANATEQQKRDRSVPRVEIFKMPSGTEYIIHDVDVNNVIIGKARFSGHVKVSETMGVEGFGNQSSEESSANRNAAAGSNDNEIGLDSAKGVMSPMLPVPPTFHPPSFGLTTLGNSHGFDKSGSVSGYVLWVNGRGIMIDPPPYSSATLEREGIRPRTIVGIILTHCHADHDAGAFQKVLTGSPVVVITTPTIYKSFIRKYAALASLSPSLLRHSHRYKPAIIGEPLRFQGATFHFIYSLHAIPCVGFKVEWRGRSMVFTGDHMNKPDELDRLEAEVRNPSFLATFCVSGTFLTSLAEKGILSKARADDLRNLPLQDTDLLLHEAGAPPIHTPLEVLMKLPQRIKNRLYVVHTSNIPEEYDLRVAPTGTAGTLRLDQLHRNGPSLGVMTSTRVERSSSTRKNRGTRDAYSISLEEDSSMPSPWSSASNEYTSISEETATRREDTAGMSSQARAGVSSGKKSAHRTSYAGFGESSAPLVSLRPASSTDAWYILNLLSAVPFMSSLSYASTMEVLETCRVDAYCKNDVVVPASRRAMYLCVVWEGTCVERNRSAYKAGKPVKSLSNMNAREAKGALGAVWHAGDWTGPIALQPEKRLSGESELSTTHDIVAMANEGVKVITIDFASLHQILKNGSSLYGKYLERRRQQQRRRSSFESSQTGTNSTPTHQLLGEAIKTLNVIDLLDQNSALRKLSAIQKRHLESLAEGPIAFGPGERLWRAGAPVDKAFLIVGGTASFVPRRRNAGSATTTAGSSSNLSLSSNTRSMLARLSENTQGFHGNNVIGEDHSDNQRASRGLEDGEMPSKNTEINGIEDMLQLESLFSRTNEGGQAKPMTEAHDFADLSKNLLKRAEMLSGDQVSSDFSIGSSHDSGSLDSDQFAEEHGASGGHRSSNGRLSVSRRRSSRARFANKVLGRLYSRRAFTGGLVFSRGHFLGDVSKMVAGLLSSDYDQDQDASFPVYGFGEKVEGTKESVHSDNLTDMVIHEQEEDSQIMHSSTLTAGNDGCVVLLFPKESLIPFLDEYPGLLLSLLGTQVVV